MNMTAVAFMLSPFIGYASDDAGPTSLPAHSRAAGFLVVEKSSVDVGCVRTASVLEVDFRLRADGGPVRLRGVRESCGCVRSKVDLVPMETGSERLVTLGVHTLSQGRGPHRYYLALDVEDPTPRSVVLSVTLDYQPDVTVEPSNLFVRLPESGASQATKRHVVRVIDRRPIPLAILGVHTSDPRLSASVVPAKNSAENAIIVQLTEPLAESKLEAAVIITTTDPTQPELEVPVTLVRQARISVVPERVKIGSAITTVGTCVKKRLFLRDRLGATNWKITAAECKDPAVRVTHVNREEGPPVVEIHADLAEVSEMRETLITLRLTEPIALDLVVPVELRPLTPK